MYNQYKQELLQDKQQFAKYTSPAAGEYKTQQTRGLITIVFQDCENKGRQKQVGDEPVDLGIGTDAADNKNKG